MWRLRERTGRESVYDPDFSLVPTLCSHSFPRSAWERVRDALRPVLDLKELRLKRRKKQNVVQDAERPE